MNSKILLSHILTWFQSLGLGTRRRATYSPSLVVRPDSASQSSGSLLCFLIGASSSSLDLLCFGMLSPPLAIATTSASGRLPRPDMASFGCFEPSPPLPGAASLSSDLLCLRPPPPSGFGTVRLLRAVAALARTFIIVVGSPLPRAASPVRIGRRPAASGRRRPYPELHHRHRIFSASSRLPRPDLASSGCFGLPPSLPEASSSLLDLLCLGLLLPLPDCLGPPPMLCLCPYSASLGYLGLPSPSPGSGVATEMCSTSARIWRRHLLRFPLYYLL